MDKAALIVAAGASAFQLKFMDIEKKTLQRTLKHFSAHFVGKLIANWSEDQPTAQLWAYSSTLAAMLSPLSEDEEVSELAINRMPAILPMIIDEMGATRCCIVATDDLPDHPEVLIVGGVSPNAHALGWIAIERHPDGRERLGSFRSFTIDDEKYVQLTSSWMMHAFDVPNERSSWWELLRSALNRIATR